MQHFGKFCLQFFLIPRRHIGFFLMWRGIKDLLFGSVAYATPDQGVVTRVVWYALQSGNFLEDVLWHRGSPLEKFCAAEAQSFETQELEKAYQNPLDAQQHGQKSDKAK